jgi:Coenzyme PQQ synthesis protein D (PqqD)
MTSSSSVRRVRAPGVLWREGEFGVVVLAHGDSGPQTLSGTAPALWHALQQPHTDLALATELARQFGVEPDRVLVDIAPVLDELTACGALIEAP